MVDIRLKPDMICLFLAAKTAAPPVEKRGKLFLRRLTVNNFGGGG